MKKLNIIVLSIIAIIMFSCETRKDVLQDSNSAPVVRISTNNTDFSENKNAIDVTLRHGCSQVLFYEYSDDNMDLEMNIECIKTTESGNTDHITFNLYKDMNKIEVSDILSKSAITGNVVKCTIKIRVSDYYGDAGEAVINIVNYDNRPPVPSIEISKIKGMEYTINAAGTTDADNDDVVAYEYLIDGETTIDSSGYEDPSDSTCLLNPGGSGKKGTYIISTPLNSVKHAFQSTGTHTIYVRAKDSIGLWSRWYSTNIDIQ